MFNSTLNPFPIVGSLETSTGTTFKFLTDQEKLYNVYFTNTNGFIEVLFDCTECFGFNVLMSDGDLKRKADTVASLMIKYEQENDFQAFWWQATRQRFLFYKAYFEANSKLLSDYNFYRDKWVEENSYGYAILSKKGDFKNIEDYVRFLM